MGLVQKYYPEPAGPSTLYPKHTSEPPNGKGGKWQCWPHPHIILLASSAEYKGGKQTSMFSKSSPMVLLCLQGGESYHPTLLSYSTHKSAFPNCPHSFCCGCLLLCCPSLPSWGFQITRVLMSTGRVLYFNPSVSKACMVSPS